MAILWRLRCNIKRFDEHNVVLESVKIYKLNALGFLYGIAPLDITFQNNFSRYEVISGNRPININNKIYNRSGIILKLKSFDFPNYYKINNIYFYEKLPQHTFDKVPLKIYKDGSVMESWTVCAYTVSQNNIFIHNHAVRSNYGNSIYQAELFAIHKALEWLATTINHSALILTDSRSSLDALRLAFPRNIIL